uniref:Saxiphilin n=1 Tax=Oryzias latipes TaxID=8090 RepID=H2N079_ORYLA
ICCITKQTEPGNMSQMCAFQQKIKSTCRFQLFSSDAFGESDLLFRDSTHKLAVVPDDMDVSQVLGLDYVALLKGSSLEDSVMRWCCISHAEQKKCEQWALSIKSDPLVCIRAASMRDCIEKIKRNEVDAVSLDATHSYIAGKCGLVPVLMGLFCCCFCPSVLPSLVAVALAKRSSRNVFMGNLEGCRSCHSYLYSPAGWLLPYRHALSPTHNGSSSCDPTRGTSSSHLFQLFYKELFWKGCLPGSVGNLCKVCMGGTGEAATKRCTDNHNERYYGNMGALRYSAFLYGDVAFLEHSGGWAQGWTSSDFELLCGDGRRATLSDWESCNLGVIPPNTIMTRPVLAARVYDLLMKSQVRSVCFLILFGCFQNVLLKIVFSYIWTFGCITNVLSLQCLKGPTPCTINDVKKQAHLDRSQYSS